MRQIRELLKTHVSAPSAYFETAVAALINITGFPLEILIGQEIPGIPDWPAYASITVGILVFLTILVHRRQPDLKVAYLLFIVNALAVAAALFIRDPYYASFAMSWVPFQASKLGSLLAALLAPSFVTGLVAIAIHLSGAALSYALIPAAVRQTIAVGEPFALLAFGVAALLTLFSRFRRIQIERRFSQVKAHALATERFSRRVLRLRDMMNTPLQVIEFSVSILRGGGASGRDDAIKGLDNAMRRLNELNELLKEHDQPSTQIAPSR